MERGSRWPRVVLILFMLLTAVGLFFLSLSLGYGYQTCSGGRVIERLPDGTPKRIVGPFECSVPDYTWRYVQVLSFVIAFCAVVVLPYYFSWRDARALQGPRTGD